MIRRVLKKELLSNLVDFKFFLILILAVIAFSSSSLVLIPKYQQRLREIHWLQNREQEKIKDKASHLSQLLEHEQVIYLMPNPLEFVASGNVLFLPAAVQVTPLSIKTQAMDRASGQSNPLIDTFADVDWIFVIGVLLSFGAIVFTYDSVSGEKENKTLGLIFANPVKRHQVLLGKFLGGVLTMLIPLAMGVVLNLSIAALYFQHFLPARDYLEILFIFLAAVLYLSFFLGLGLMVSSLFQKSITSFGVLFFIWVLLVFIVPKASGILGSLLHPIMDQSQIREMRILAVKDVEKKYRGHYGKVEFNKPFARETALWVESTNESQAAQQKILNNHVMQMIGQAEAARTLSLLSPYSVFKYTSEDLSNSGLPRVKRFMNNAGLYQQTLLDFLQTEDRKDPDSPHLLFPHFFSQKKTDYHRIPRFEMMEYRVTDLLSGALLHLFLLMVYNILVLGAAYFTFLRYDVR
jgi:ABC-type transport system involved in multi-copper enzyme maturation permease subunit